MGAAAGPKLDLAFKAGQTIRINIPKNAADGCGTSRDNRKGQKGLVGGGLLPPPPSGAGRIAPPPSLSNLTPLQSPSEPTAPRTVIGIYFV